MDAITLSLLSSKEQFYQFFLIYGDHLIEMPDFVALSPWRTNTFSQKDAYK